MSVWEHDASFHWHPSTCGHDVTSTRVAHSFDEAKTPATYTSGGYTTYTCSVCGYSYKANETSKLEHHYSNEWSHDAASHWHACTDEGYASLKSDEAAHDFQKETTDPTHASGGYTIYTCRICGYSYKGDVTSPLPITITWKNYDGSLLKTTTVSYGETPSYGGAAPTKEGDAQCSYAFQGWCPDLGPVTEETTYTAKFTSQTNLYSVTWKDYDGTVLDVDNLPYGAVPSYEGSDPVRAHDSEYSYRFAGWSPEIVSVVGEATYTARYEATRSYFTISYSPNGGSGGPASQLKEKGADLTIPSEIPERSGYTFIGWNCLLSGDVFQAGDSVTFDEDTTFFAMWCEHCSNCDGKGKVEQSNSCSSCSGKGEISKSDIVWISCSSCNGKGYFSTTAVCSSCNGWGGSVLCDCSCGYSWWASKTNSRICAKCGKSVKGTRYTTCSTCSGKGTATKKTDCSYCGGNGGVYVTRTTASKCTSCGGAGKIAKEVTCPSCKGSPLIYPEAPTLVSCGNDSIVVEEKEGYEYSLDGENWQKSGTFDGLSEKTPHSVYQRIASTASRPFGMTSLPLEVTTTLTTYKITYDLNGGTNASENPATYTVENDFSLESPTRAGYTFVGWYSGSEKVSSIGGGATGDLSLSARWELATYAITYDLNGGTNASENPVSYTVESPDIVLEDPSRAGYEFKGWFDDSGNRIERIPSGSAGEVSISARWQAIEYRITYDFNGGDPVSNLTAYTVEDSFSLESPTRAGYTFAGWYSGSEKVSSIGGGATGDLSLSARWELDSYAITYDLNGGTNASENPVSYTVKSPDISLVDPTRDGYTFDGWYLDSSFETKADSIPSGSTGNASFYAKWSPIKHSLTVASCDEAKGIVAITDGEGYTDEDMTVSASPIGDWAFKGWYSGNELISRDNPYVFEMPSNDYSLTALFWTRAEEEKARREALGMVPVIDTENKTITYGLYPQTRVSNEPTIASLNELSSHEANGWYLLDGEYYAKASASPCSSCYAFDDGTPIVPGTTYWFKCEPIIWKILSSTDDGEYSLVSTVLLDMHRYNAYWSEADSNGHYANNYEQSEIRAWLNGDFYNKAFSLGNSFIQTTTVDNSASTTDSSSNSWACNNTEDKVYLLSYQDYINTEFSVDSTATQCKLTDWVRANTNSYSMSSSFQYNGNYWTRSPYSTDDSFYAWYVTMSGGFSFSAVNYSSGGARPAITIKVAQ